MTAERVGAGTEILGQSHYECQTNIVIFRMAEGAPDAATIVARAQDAGVLLSAFAARTVCAVTHLDVSREQCQRAADLLAVVIERG